MITKDKAYTSKYTLYSSKSTVGFQILFGGAYYFEFFLKMYDYILYLSIPIIEIAHDMSEALKNSNVHKKYLGCKGLKLYLL